MCAGKSDGRRNNIRLGLESKAAEPAPRRSLLPCPAQGVSQRSCIGCESAFHFQRRPITDVSVEREIERRTGEPYLEPRAVAAQSGDEIGKADARGDLLIVPDKSAGCGEAARDGRPGKLEFHLGQFLSAFVCLILQNEGAVLDANLQKTMRPGAAQAAGCGPRLRGDLTSSSSDRGPRPQ